MNMYLVAAFVLLLAMLALVLRPFLYATVPAGDAELDLTDPAAKARSVAKVERVSRSAPAGAAAATAVATTQSSEAPADEAATTDGATTGVATTAAPAVDAPPVDDSSVHDVTPVEPVAAAPAADDVRASVEAAIAARKAALKAKHCSSCEAVLEDGDAFCRSCGTKATA